MAIVFAKKAKLWLWDPSLSMDFCKNTGLGLSWMGPGVADGLGELTYHGMVIVGLL